MGGRNKLIVADIDSSGKNEYTLQTLNDVREFKFVTGLDITGMGAVEVNTMLKSSLAKLAPKKKKPIKVGMAGAGYTPKPKKKNICENPGCSNKGKMKYRGYFTYLLCVKCYFEWYHAFCEWIHELNHWRCIKCGRKKGYMRTFGVCRICFRELASSGNITREKKSSW